jgi:hypothetical protein
MSHDDAKVKHSKRLHKTESHIQKRVKLAKDYGIPVKEPHKFDKMNPVNCGDSNCVMCGNPRKFFNERTLQEKKFIQTEKWDEND